MSVKTGVWLDFARGWPNSIQITVSKGWGDFTQLALGVLLGALWPYLSRIFSRLAEWIFYAKNCRKRRSELDRVEEHHPLVSNGAIYDIDEPACNTSPQRSWIFPPLLSLFVIIGSIGWAVASSLASGIPADSQGLSSSRHCGSWSLKRSAGEKAEADDVLIQSEKERRAGQYGRSCYGYGSVTSPDQCSFFSTQAIDYTTSSTECPFSYKSFCSGDGIQIARRFTTGLVDATVIGINTPEPPKFNRTTICVPLNIDQGFVKEIPPDEFHHDHIYEYYLGSTNSSGYISNFTFRTEGDPFNYRVPSYLVSAYESTPYGPRHDFWNPVRELDIMYAGATYFTIMFISSCRIIYRGSCEDYIFPATQEYPRGTGRYLNGDPRARPLACIDWNEVCTYNGICRSMEEEYHEYGIPYEFTRSATQEYPRGTGRYLNGDPRARPLACIDWNEVCTYNGICRSMEEEYHEYGIPYEFTRSALRESTVYKSIKTRLGSAFIANEKVGDYESRKLDPKQWVIESESLFNASLARIQYDALDIAVGAGHENAPESYEEITPKWAQGKLCNMYKFQLPPGYTNINIWVTFSLLLIVILIYALGNEAWRGDFSDEQRPYFKGRMLWFDAVLVWILFPTVRLIYRCGRCGIYTFQRWFRRGNSTEREHASSVVAYERLLELGTDRPVPELE